MKYPEARDFIIKKLSNELDPDLTYHRIEHTLDVLNAAGNFAELEGISAHDRIILETAALFHDSGMLTTYIGHEDASVDIARKYLPEYGYETRDIDLISDMIITTKLPQSASTFLEKILCDADLDYLGRSDMIPVSNTLFKELKEQNKIGTLNDWNKLQLKFISGHSYFTKTARSLREVNKQKQIERISKLITED